MAFKFYPQTDEMDCGPACLRMVAKHYDVNISMQKIRDYCQIGRQGVTLLNISEAAEQIGFHSLGVKLKFNQLSEVNLPCILHWDRNHFVVLYKINKKRFYIADPTRGQITLDKEDFIDSWCDKNQEGVALILEPTPDIGKNLEDEIQPIKLSQLFSFLSFNKKLIAQLFFGLAMGSLLQLMMPILTQKIVDVGINQKNISFIYLVLVAQFMLLFGATSVDFIRSWILLFISSRMNIVLQTSFLIKLMKLPISFFDSKKIGDIMQRLQDQKRIEQFFTGSTLSTLFSIFNLLIFSFVLVYYSTAVFFVFLISTIIYTSWILFFFKKRREIDSKLFKLSSKHYNQTIQIVNGMQEIKLNSCEKQMRWDWEYLQASTYKFNVRSLMIKQYEQGGSFFINHAKNILITIISAKAVIEGDITLGSMMAIQYIVGQLNSPLEQFLNFANSFQDATISVERLNEVYTMQDEEIIPIETSPSLPVSKSIEIKNFNFRYPGTYRLSALDNINLIIPEGKTTAIVGTSGSGKTTLLKLLLRFYKGESGEITVGGKSIDQISFKSWRRQCGVVMQDGFIFSDTVAKNIAIGDKSVDYSRLEYAMKIANISEFVRGLPKGIETVIGVEGTGISQGQKQRLLIARAIYKNPEYIFFDEATNSLDSLNESIIIENLAHFFKGKTVVVVAHRLSTVKNADQIVVLEKGKIIELGQHSTLINLRGAYFDLVKNQLELETVLTYE